MGKLDAKIVPVHKSRLYEFLCIYLLTEMLKGLSRVVLQHKGTKQIQTMRPLAELASITPGKASNTGNSCCAVLLHKGWTLALGR